MRRVCVNIFVAFVILFPVFMLGVIAGLLIDDWYYSEQLHHVGIDNIAECSIVTPNCHSNWYEIVWIDEKKGTEK